MENKSRIACAVLLLTLVSGCEAQDLFENRLEFGSPVELSSGIAVVEHGTQRVFLLEVSPTSARARTLFAAGKGTDIVWMRSGPATDDTLFLLTAPASERDTGIGVTLVRLDAATGAAARFEVGTSFDQAAFDPDGRFLLLYHGSQAASGSFYNPSEVALIDLAEDPGSANPLLMSVQMGGRAIEDVLFVPALDVAGTKRRLVAFIARGMVKLVDLLEPQAGTVSVKLSPDSAPGSILTRQILARPGDGERDPTLFLRASGTNDIYAVSLVPRGDGQPGFWATLNMYDGRSPRDMALVEDAGRPLLVVAAGSAAVVIDTDTADSFSLTLNGAAQQVLRREDEVVLFGGGAYRIHFLATQGLYAAKGSNLSGLQIPDGIDWSMPLDGDRLLMTTYTGDLLVLDLATRILTRLAGAGYVDWSLAAVHGDVFFLGEPDADRVITLDLATGHPAPLVLDEPVLTFHLFAGSGMGLVVHPRPTGRATLFPLAEPTRDRAFVVDGFWLEGFLNDTEVQP